MNRYEAAPHLDDLRDFQRRTVDHVFHQFYGPDPSRPLPRRRRDRPGQEHGGPRRHRPGHRASPGRRLRQPHRRRLRLLQRRPRPAEHQPAERHRREAILRQPADPAGRALRGSSAARVGRAGSRSTSSRSPRARRSRRAGSPARPRNGRCSSCSSTELEPLSTGTRPRRRTDCFRAGPAPRRGSASSRRQLREQMGDGASTPRSCGRSRARTSEGRPDSLRDRFLEAGRRSGPEAVGAGPTCTDETSSRARTARRAGPGQRRDPGARPGHPRRVPALPAPARPGAPLPASSRTTSSSSRPRRFSCSRPRRTSRSPTPKRAGDDHATDLFNTLGFLAKDRSDVDVARSVAASRVPRVVTRRRGRSSCHPSRFARTCCKLMSRAERPVLVRGLDVRGACSTRPPT